jgi:hypothetical protein
VLLAGHGGEQRAVLVYQVQSYQHWQRHFGRDGEAGRGWMFEAEIDPSTLDQQFAGLMDTGAYRRLAGG